MIRRLLKYLLILLVAVLIVIQFINRPEKIYQEVNEQDMLVALDARIDIKNLFETACYDCHSFQPRYPWYASIAPVSWWIDGHMRHGRGELNFSEWATFSKRKRDHKLEEIIEEVEGGHMPLPSYTWVHTDARLTDEQIASLKAWVEAERTKIAQED